MRRTALAPLLLASAAACAGAGANVRPTPTTALAEDSASDERDAATARLCAAFLAGRDPELAEMGLEGGCVAAGTGVWQLETEVRATECDPDWSFGRWEGRARVVFRPIDGASAPLPWVELSGCDAETEFRVLAHHDWDGDGDEELALRVITTGAEDGSMTNGVFHFDGGVVVPYPAVAAFARGLTNALDVDEDGRPDLISVLPLQAAISSWSADGAETFTGSVLTLWHAQPDGTFARDDDVARAFLGEQCTSADAAYFSANDLQVIAEASGGIGARSAVICARLRGIDMDELRRGLEAELRDIPCDVSPPEACYAVDVVTQLMDVATDLDVSVQLD